MELIRTIVPVFCCFIDQVLGGEHVASFLYGSVARGEYHSKSDIDCFVVSRSDIPATVRSDLRKRACLAQLELGFCPDPDFPIECFSHTRISELLSLFRRDNYLQTTSGRESLEDLVSCEDDLEILKALLGTKTVITGDQTILELEKATQKFFFTHAHDSGESSLLAKFCAKHGVR